MSRWNAISLAIAIVASALSLTAWSFASPVGAGPDDDYHLASIWCGGGTNETLCQPGRDPGERYLPTAFSQSNCFALHPEISASCQGKNFGIDQTQFGFTTRGNFTGDYPPIFYFAMSQLAGEHIDVSVLLMRVLNCLLFVFLTTISFFVINKNLRIPLLVGMLSTIIPLGVFVIASINPSSWVLISACLLWPLLVTFFSASGKRRILALFLSLLLVAMASGARADGGIFAVLACVVAMALTFSNTRSWWKSVWIFAAIIGISLLSIWFSHQSNAAINGVASGDENIDLSVLITANLIQLPSLLVGIFGTWGLGWLDTEMPGSVWVSTLFIFSALVFWGMGYFDKKKAVAATFLFSALIAYPLALLVSSSSFVGTNVQPRYVLPLIIMFAGVVFLGATENIPAFSRTQGIIGGALLWIAFTVALQVNIRRYVTGVDVMGWNLSKDAEWWWSFGPTPMVIWIVGSLGFALLVSVLVTSYFREIKTAKAY